MIDGARAGYWLARGGLAAAGAMAILATASSYLLMPELFYDRQPDPPPLGDRLPGMAIGFGIGALMLVPYRWTLGGWLFAARLAVSVVVGAILICAGLSALVDGLWGGRSLAIFPTGLGLILAGMCLPGCLWWRRRLASGRGGGGPPPS